MQSISLIPLINLAWDTKQLTDISTSQLNNAKIKPIFPIRIKPKEGGESMSPKSTKAKVLVGLRGIFLGEFGVRKLNRLQRTSAARAFDRCGARLGRKREPRSGFQMAGVFISSLFLFLFITGSMIAAPRPDKPGKDSQKNGWQDDFRGKKLNSKRWVIASGWAPGYIPGDHINLNDPAKISMKDGYLVIALTQENGTVDEVPGVISKGGMIHTADTYGYGTYEWRMRMSTTAPSPTDPGTPVSGSRSAGFSFVNNSETEIDFEYIVNLRK